LTKGYFMIKNKWDWGGIDKIMIDIDAGDNLQ
jgi:hypothetical protein